MDVKDFLIELLSALGKVDFVEDIHLQVEGLTVAGRIVLKEDRFVEIYYNELTGTLAFALIEKAKRIWGIDRDRIRGWHVHPLRDSEKHVETRSLSVTEIIRELTRVWENL